MKVSQILKNNKQGVSLEFFPPKGLKGESRLRRCVERLKEYRPLYASMTCGAAGSTQTSTQHAVSLLLENPDLEVMPHVTCIDVHTIELERLLNDYRQQGVENIMALRGDSPQEQSDFDFSRQEFSYACDLVRFIKKKFTFCLGVAVYPEGHIESSSQDQDLFYTKRKIEEGADFAVTQMFFDNTYFYNFVDRARKEGISIPILPGILPLTDIEKIKNFTAICRATIPDKIEQELLKYKSSPQDMQKRGIDYTIQQCRDLKKNGHNILHFFTLNNAEVVSRILQGL
jgi:methylenetetrahydrofolate reductase (NADPH)